MLLMIDGAATKSRTRDPLITSQMLYQLSYSGSNHQCHGAGTKSRTRDPLITSQVLYQLSYTGNVCNLLMVPPPRVELGTL